MLRELQTVLNKNTDAMYKADAPMVTGMGVVKDFATKTVGFPSAKTAEGIFFVNKERIPIGINSAMSDLSDYFEDFTNVKKDEFVKLVTPLAGERYGVDQYDATGLAEDDTVAVDTNGKWVKADAVKSRFVYGGIYSDANTHTLAVIEVIDTAR